MRVVLLLYNNLLVRGVVPGELYTKFLTLLLQHFLARCVLDSAPLRSNHSSQDCSDQERVSHNTRIAATLCSAALAQSPIR